MEYTQEHFEKRQNYITGTRIAPILGLSRYKNKLDIYLDMIKPYQESISNPQMEVGNILEPYVLNRLARETGQIVTRPIESFYVAEDAEFCGGSLDGEMTKVDTIVEAKTTREKGVDIYNKPDWYCQSQWYMFITKKKACFLAYLTLPETIDDEMMVKRFNHLRDKDPMLAMPEYYLLDVMTSFDFILIARDNHYIESMLEAAKKFYFEHYTIGNPPEATDYSEALRLYPSGISGKIEYADLETRNVAYRYKELNDKIKILENEKEELKSLIATTIKDSESLYYEDKALFTWTNNKDSETFNVELFKKAYPDIYKKYLTYKQGARVLRCKI